MWRRRRENWRCVIVITLIQEKWLDDITILKIRSYETGLGKKKGPKFGKGAKFKQERNDFRVLHGVFNDIRSFY